MSKSDDTIVRYLDQQERFTFLAQEVAFLVEQRLQEKQIGYASVTWRIKTIDSLLNKIKRKGYTDPLNQVTDVAGVRIVHLYHVDQPKILEIIENEFKIIEHSDKQSLMREDEFGYSAHHYNVKISPKYYGPRYDRIRNLSCELQVRTVLQDAWAIVSHHLQYKNETAVPKPLRRKLNALAGTFEVADHHLDSLRSEREKYKTSIGQQSEKTLSSEELNLDTYLHIIREQYPDLPLETTPGAAENVYDILQHSGIRTVGQLRYLYERTRDARKEFAEREQWGASQARHAFVALGLVVENALLWFSQQDDVELLKELQGKYMTIDLSLPPVKLPISADI